MPLNSQFNAAITLVLKNLNPVIQSLKARKDYSNPRAPFDVQEKTRDLSAYKQLLMTTQASGSQEDADALLAMTKEPIQPDISLMISSNITLSRMGQLNTDRTIEPVTATGQNKLLGSLEDSIMKMVAASQYSPQPAPPPDPPPPPPPVVGTTTIAIRSIQFTSRHENPPGTKSLVQNAANTYTRADGVNVATTLDNSAAAYNAQEWDITRGGGGPEPFSQTQNTAPALTVVCRVGAVGGSVTVVGFAGQLAGTPGQINGANYGPGPFNIALNQTGMLPGAPAVIASGATQDFTLTFTGGANFPTEIGVADLGLSVTVNSNAPAVTDNVAAASRVYLTFGAPAGTVTSPAPNDFALGGNVQSVTPARLELAIQAVRDGSTSGIAGVPGFAYANAEACVDASFLFLKNLGVSFALGYRWQAPINETGLTNTVGGAQPPLHTYLWMAMSPLAGVVPPANLPATEAWAECHNLAVAFVLLNEILGLAPFVVNYGTGNLLGYATDYPQPRRADIAPYPPMVGALKGALHMPYNRNFLMPNTLPAQQSLGFVDQHGGVNNFEGVTIFNNARLYPIGEVILADNNRDTNANNYYAEYDHTTTDYVDPANGVPLGFNGANGLAPLVFSGDWIWWFLNGGGGIGWSWQNGYVPDPYPGTVVPFLSFGIPGCFWWQN
ncbi:hypothetical protein [Kordiimonas sp.]|uniref:hypothetical protein n=1 Tax=Kordiimonas sp. TaxID=1970157 RepID=UPI003A95CD4F